MYICTETHRIQRDTHTYIEVDTDVFIYMGSLYSFCPSKTRLQHPLMLPQYSFAPLCSQFYTIQIAIRSLFLNFQTLIKGLDLKLHLI